MKAKLVKEDLKSYLNTTSPNLNENAEEDYGKTVNEIDWLVNVDDDDPYFSVVRNIVLAESEYANTTFYYMGSEMDGVEIPGIESPNIEGSETQLQVTAHDIDGTKWIGISLNMYKQNTYYFADRE